MERQARKFPWFPSGCGGCDLVPEREGPTMRPTSPNSSTSSLLVGTPENPHVGLQDDRCFPAKCGKSSEPLRSAGCTANLTDVKDDEGTSESRGRVATSAYTCTWRPEVTGRGERGACADNDHAGTSGLGRGGHVTNAGYFTEGLLQRQLRWLL